MSQVRVLPPEPTKERFHMEDMLSGIRFGIGWTLILFFLFQVKHMVVDFFVQNRFPYMWMNKGKIIHPGGWLHAGGHGVVSFGIFYLTSPPTEWFGLAISLCAMEILAHFTIDYLKVGLTKMMDWKCNTSPYFWDLLGVDQFLHQLTYLFMILLWGLRLT